MSKEHPEIPSHATTEQKVARRIALCLVLPVAMAWSAATHLFREPRNAWRLICMDAHDQIQIAKNAWARWWEF
jgi:hypothetical protein